MTRGTAPEALLDVTAVYGADLILLAAHGYGAVKRALFGSVASKLIRESPIPVIVVKHQALASEPNKNRRGARRFKKV
jgi:nucleotide-binding universal stress UspA family protein